MRFQVRIRGRGRVEVPAHGVADAEHLVEKELRRQWPRARVTIEEIARVGPARIVEEFLIRYLLEGELEVAADTAEEAARVAFRDAREMLADGRYRRTVWEAREVKEIEV